MGGERSIVQIDADAEDAELAADALWQAGPTAVGEVELGDGRVRLTADVLDPSLVDGRWSPVVVPDEGDAHLDAWRSWATPLRAGRRTVLHPAWIPRDAAGEEDLVVVLDPGRAFGSGSHESTRLVLALLEEVVRPGVRVLDVGCGSGVLAVVACLLGAASATGIDVAPEAIDATLANAERNGVHGRVTADLRPLVEVDGTYDLVLANISAATIRALAPDLERRVAPMGLLVVAGLLEEQVDDVAASLGGCAVRRRADEGGWSALVLQRS